MSSKPSKPPIRKTPVQVAEQPQVQTQGTTKNYTSLVFIILIALFIYFVIMTTIQQTSPLVVQNPSPIVQVAPENPEQKNNLDFNIWIAFITGLTAGGLSCMAVQGGLLASSLANQVEHEMQNQSKQKQTRHQLAQPILVFLIAKLVAYTILGFLLGALGSTLTLTPMMRAILQFAIGIFMIGNALRMFNVHPIFRYFSFEPPSFITRFIRKSSKGQTSLGSPVFLGVMTVLIPCGISQSMMAVALGTANPLAGAAIMFAFTLGASPVFFALSYSAARLGAVMEKYFMRLVAATLLILGIWAVDTGLNLSGAPFSLTSLVQDWISPSAASAAPSTNVATASSAPSSSSASTQTANNLTLYAQDFGYSPRVLNATAGQPIKLNVITKNTRSCAVAFMIPELRVQKVLPSTGTVVFDIPAQPKGKSIRFSCSMGMYTGQIIFN